MSNWWMYLGVFGFVLYAMATLSNGIHQDNERYAFEHRNDPVLVSDPSECHYVDRDHYMQPCED